MFIVIFCFLLCIGVDFVMLHNQAKHQKGLLLGVTLPPEADTLPEVQQIVQQFRKRLGLICLLCAVSCIPLTLVHDTALFLTLWTFWFLAGFTLPYLPLFQANAQLKALKKAHGWQGVPCRIVDTSASAAALPRPIGLWTLLLPLLLSLLPLLLPGLPRGIALACGIDAGCLVLLWAIGRWTFRRREDMVTNDSTCNQTLLRVRRLYWDRFWRLGIWAMAVLNLILAFSYRSTTAILGFTLFFALFLLLGSLWMECSVRRIQARLTADTVISADEDDAWLGGVLYCAPQDRRFFVARRLGLGATVNLGTTAGKVYYAVTGLILAACLAIGPVFGLVDSIPVRLELTGSAPVCLTAFHGSREKYTLNTDTITDVQLRDTLPEATRTWGTGMDHYLEGDFYVVGEGPAQFCLDPTQSLFLRVEANGTVYWFSAEQKSDTAALAQQLNEALPARHVSS